MIILAAPATVGFVRQQRENWSGHHQRLPGVKYCDTVLRLIRAVGALYPVSAGNLGSHESLVSRGASIAKLEAAQLLGTEGDGEP